MSRSWWSRKAGFSSVTLNGTVCVRDLQPLRGRYGHFHRCMDLSFILNPPPPVKSSTFTLQVMLKRIVPLVRLRGNSIFPSTGISCSKILPPAKNIFLSSFPRVEASHLFWNISCRAKLTSLKLDHMSSRSGGILFLLRCSCET